MRNEQGSICGSCARLRRQHQVVRVKRKTAELAIRLRQRGEAAPRSVATPPGKSGG